MMNLIYIPTALNPHEILSSHHPYNVYYIKKDEIVVISSLAKFSLTGRLVSYVMLVKLEK